MGIQETQRNFKESAYWSVTDHLGMRVGFHYLFFFSGKMLKVMQSIMPIQSLIIFIIS